MLCGHPADLFVVRAHVSRLGANEAPIDEDVGNAPRFDALEEFRGGRRLCRRNDQSVDLTRHQTLYFARFQYAILFGIADHYVEPKRSDGFGYALGDLRK